MKLSVRQTINNIRDAIDGLRAKKSLFKPVAIALDTKGPEIRTGLLKGGGSAIVTLVKGKTITLSLNEAHREEGNIDRIFVDYKNLPKVIEKGTKVKKILRFFIRDRTIIYQFYHNILWAFSYCI